VQTRLFSLEQCVVSPEQKENLFATVAELFDHSCISFEEATLEESSRDAETSGSGEWWVPALERTVGWVTAAVEKREVAVPSPRAQILRLAALVDSDALCWMAEKELFGSVDDIVRKLEGDASEPEPEAAAQGSKEQVHDFRSKLLEKRCRSLILGIRQMLTAQFSEDSVPAS